MWPVIDRRIPRAGLAVDNMDGLLPNGLERGAHFAREEFRLLPGREVTASVDLVEVGEIGVDLLGPMARGLEDLIGEQLSVEEPARDLLVAVGVMVKHPRCQPDRRVRQAGAEVCGRVFISAM